MWFSLPLLASLEPRRSVENKYPAAPLRGAENAAEVVFHSLAPPPSNHPSQFQQKA